MGEASKYDLSLLVAGLLSTVCKGTRVLSSALTALGLLQLGSQCFYKHLMPSAISLITHMRALEMQTHCREHYISRLYYKF